MKIDFEFTNDRLLREYLNKEYHTDIDILEFMIVVPELLHKRRSFIDNVLYIKPIPMEPSDYKIIDKSRILPVVTCITYNALCEIYNDTKTTTAKDICARIGKVKQRINQIRRDHWGTDHVYDEINYTLCHQLSDLIQYHSMHDIGNLFGERHIDGENICDDSVSVHSLARYNHRIIHKNHRSAQELVTFYQHEFTDIDTFIYSYIRDIIRRYIEYLFTLKKMPQTSTELIADLIGFPTITCNNGIEEYMNTQELEYVNGDMMFINLMIGVLYSAKLAPDSEKFINDLDDAIIAYRTEKVEEILKSRNEKIPKSQFPLESEYTKTTQSALESVFESVSEFDIQTAEIDNMQESFKSKLSQLSL